MTAFTVILPHKRNLGNDRALSVALDCLFTNTVNEFHLLMDVAYNQPLYPRINRMVEQAHTDCIVYWCSDLFAAKAWDVPMLALYTPDTFVTGIVVEPGVMGINPKNVEEDFGRKPETFRLADFEAFAEARTRIPDGIGFPAPYMVSRKAFLELGGMEDGLAGDHQGFTPADVRFMERWQQSGRKVVRAVSYVYHLQRYSELAEQQKEARG